MPDTFIDWCYAMVEEVMARYGYPSDPDGEEREPEPQEIPLLKAA
jgi:hypothetical protein